MPRLIGYERHASAEILAAHVELLERHGCAAVYSSTRSGLSVLRPELEQAIDKLAAGDALVVTRLGALAHDVRDVGPIVLQIEKRGAHLVSLQDRLDTRTDGGRFFGFVRMVDSLQDEAVAERRHRKALAEVPNEGGRPPSISDEAWAEMEPKIRCKELSVSDAAVKLGVNRSTVHRRLKPTPTAEAA